MSLKLFFLITTGIVCTHAQVTLVQIERPNLYDSIRTYSVNPISIFGQAAGVVGLREQLSDPDFQGTILAPSDDAFHRLWRSFNISSRQLYNGRQVLKDLISYHVVPNYTITTDRWTALLNGDNSFYMQGNLPTLLDNELIHYVVGNLTIYANMTEGYTLGNITLRDVKRHFGDNATRPSLPYPQTGYTDVTFDINGFDIEADTADELDYEGVDIIIPDIRVGRSVVHVIDRVMVPGSMLERIANLSTEEDLPIDPDFEAVGRTPAQEGNTGSGGNRKSRKSLLRRKL